MKMKLQYLLIALGVIVYIGFLVYLLSITPVGTVNSSVYSGISIPW